MASTVLASFRSSGTTSDFLPEGGSKVAQDGSLRNKPATEAVAGLPSWVSEKDSDKSRRDGRRGSRKAREYKRGRPVLCAGQSDDSRTNKFSSPQHTFGRPYGTCFLLYCSPRTAAHSQFRSYTCFEGCRPGLLSTLPPGGNQWWRQK